MEEEKTKVCPKCGAEVKEDDVFCSNCGYSLKRTDVCPVCGQPMNGGNFCTKCGYSVKKNNLTSSLNKNAIMGKIRTLASSKVWTFIKKFKKVFIAVLIIMALTAAIVPTVVFLDSPYRKGKIDKIELGITTQENAKNILGKPYIQTTVPALIQENGILSIEILNDYSLGGNDIWVYYENKVVKTLNKIDKEIEKADSLEDLEKLDKKYAKFFDKPFKSIVLAFDDTGKVSFVCFNKKTKYDSYDYFASTAKKEVKNVTLSKNKVGINTSLSENKIVYTAMFKDGSILKSYLTSGSVEGYDSKTEGVQVVRFKDGWAEYEQRMEVKEYNLKVECNLEGVKIVGSGYYEEGDEVTLSVVGGYDQTRYEFVGWANNGVVISTDNPYTFKYSSDLSLSVEFRNGLFEYSDAGRTITGVKDKTIIEAVIPEEVTRIGDYAFQDCSSLISITIPDSVTSIGSYAFYNCSSLISITIPDSVTSIGAGAFYGCSGLTSIIIPDSVTSIGNSAFSGCSSLTSITIPDSVKSVGIGAFFNCPIETATISTFAIPFIPTSALKNVTITSGTSLPYSAFSGCSSLTSITIPDSVTSIGIWDFFNCTSLKSITIPESLTDIGTSAFAGCAKLTSIKFQGTKSKWNAINKGAGWDNNTGSYTIHCTDGDISK